METWADLRQIRRGAHQGQVLGAVGCWRPTRLLLGKLSEPFVVNGLVDDHAMRVRLGHSALAKTERKTERKTLLGAPHACSTFAGLCIMHAASLDCEASTSRTCTS